jgi:hypothetical protein
MSNLQKFSETFFQSLDLLKDIKHETKVYNLSQSKQQIDRLKKLKASFVVERTKSTCKITYCTSEFKRVLWYLENSKSKYFLIMLQRLKKEIQNRKFYVLNCEYSGSFDKVKYFEFKKDIENFTLDAGSYYELDNVFEADISHAYYRACYVLGFISKELYTDIIKKLSKHDRLRLLGCIASIKTTDIYENGILKNPDAPAMQDELLRMAWFKICNYIDTALIDLKFLLGDDFLFYWVDGIYFKVQNKTDVFTYTAQWYKIRQISLRYNLDFKTIPIKKFTLSNKKDYLEILIEKPDGSLKQFFPPKKQVKGYYFK